VVWPRNPLTRSRARSLGTCPEGNPRRPVPKTPRAGPSYRSSPWLWIAPPPRAVRRLGGPAAAARPGRTSAAPRLACDRRRASRAGTRARLGYARRMKRVGTVMGLLFVGGCGLFDLGDGDSDSNSGGSNSNSQSDSRGSNSGDADVTSLGGPTDGHGPGGDDWWTEDSGYTEPPTTGIEPTGADNDAARGRQLPLRRRQRRHLCPVEHRQRSGRFDPTDASFDVRHRHRAAAA
jgi:hypothetical protein